MNFSNDFSHVRSAIIRHLEINHIAQGVELQKIISKECKVAPESVARELRKMSVKKEGYVPVLTKYQPDRYVEYTVNRKHPRYKSNFRLQYDQKIIKK